MNWKLHLCVFFFAVGSCLFILGSICFHPHFSRIDALLKIGVLSLTFGSVLFFLGSFQQLLDNFRSLSSNNNASLIDEIQLFNIDLAVSICRNTIGSINGILFTVGSAAFWPTYGHGGALVGNWLYRCGATLGAMSCIWLLIRLHMKSTTFTMMKLVTILSLFGSIGFLIGGGYFLTNGKHDVEGSFAWLCGSISFLSSSLLIYKL